MLAATACVALILAIALYKLAITAHWREPVVPILYCGFAVLSFLFVHALHNGRGWARGLTIGLGGISLVLLLFRWRESDLDGLFLIQTALQAVAVVLLLLPSSRDWFHPPKNVG